jgi:hypothetical protein
VGGLRQERVAEGGAAYANPRVYGWSALAEGAVVLGVAWSIAIALLRRSWRWATGAGLAVALAAFAVAILR